MKKVLTSLLLISSLSSFAKEKKDPAFEKGTVIAIAALGYPNLPAYLSPKVSIGPIIVGVDYQVSRRFSFGLQYAYCYSATGLRSVNGINYSFQYERKKAIHSFMVNGDVYFLNKGKISLSSGLGLGYAMPVTSQYFSDNIDHSDQLAATSSNSFAYQLRVIDVKARLTKNLGLYGSFGYGVQGIVSVGVHYTVTSRK